VNDTLTVSTPDGAMGIHVVRPSGGGPFPVILFFHHGPGLDDGSKEAMQLGSPYPGARRTKRRLRRVRTSMRSHCSAR